MQNLYFYTFYFFYFYFYFVIFWAGLSQPGPVTGPSQWPGWAEQNTCTCVFLHCASELKFTCTVQMLIKRNNARRKGYLPGLPSAFLLRPSSFLLFCEFVLLLLFCQCLLVPLVSSLFFFLFLFLCFASLFLCWFALFFSWSRPPFSVALSLSPAVSPSLFSSSSVCVCSCPRVLPSLFSSSSPSLFSVRGLPCFPSRVRPLLNSRSLAFIAREQCLFSVMKCVNCRCNGGSGGGRPFQSGKMNSQEKRRRFGVLRFGPWRFNSFVIKPLVKL